MAHPAARAAPIRIRALVDELHFGPVATTLLPIGAHKAVRRAHPAFPSPGRQALCLP